MLKLLSVPKYSPPENVIHERPPISEDEVKEALAKKIASRMAGKFTDNELLTVEEAAVVDAQIDSMIAYASAIKDHIIVVDKKIQDHVRSVPLEADVSVDLENRPTLRRALKRLYGQESEVITYDMYREAVDALRKLENEDVKDYVANK